MTIQNDKIIEYHPALLADRYRRRQSQPDVSVPVLAPNHAPPDQSSWFGGKKESPAVRRHNSQLDAIDFASKEAEFALLRGLRLEYVSLRNAINTVTAGVQNLNKLPPQSLEAVVAEKMLFDSVERIQSLVTEANHSFRRKALE